MKRIILILLFVTRCNLFLIAQSINGIEHQNKYLLHIHKTPEKIKLDGELNETVWKDAEVATDFSNWVPQDIGKPKRETEVRTTYNDQYLYIGVTGFDTSYDVIKTLKRDAEIGSSDGIGIVLDAINQRTSGFAFVLNTMNVQAEDGISGNKAYNDWSWDNKWFSSTKRYIDRWTMEIAIPFKTLRYSTGKKVWGINFARGDLKNNEYSTWTKLSSNISWLDLGFTGAIIWDEPPPVPGKNISFIPYTKSSLSGDRENGESLKSKVNAGFDTKLAVTSAMNLDFTVNPDFSQVEVDQQVTNLTRFNIFFPEKRNFFLENSDLFSEYGLNEIRPFYSRTIGLDHDGNAIPILGGARLSGNITKKMRIGVMNIQTQKKNDFDAQNYTAISLNERILDRSVIKAYFLNRNAFMNEDQRAKNPLDVYGRNAGIEFNFSDKRGLLKSWGGYHLSFKPGVSEKNSYWQAGAGYFSRAFTSSVSSDNAGTNYYTDMGFVQRIENYDAEKDTVFRLGFRQLANPNKYTIYPKKGSVNQHVFELNNLFVWNPDGSFNEGQYTFGYSINFKSTSQIKTGLVISQVNLNYPVKFVNDDSALLLPIATYRFTQWNFAYNTDTRKLFNFSTGIASGQFFNGIIRQYNTGINLRRQPWGNFSLNFEYDKLKFPEQYGSADLFLIASRIEIGFSNSVFWTTFLQYQTQDNNFNINSRFQWRFKPMSDIFLVYTDNYFTDPLFKSRNRAVVLKMNWWLNL